MTDSKAEESSPDLNKEMESLREQINLLEEQSEFKQKAIADLAREKEKLSIDLRKQQRSNLNLKQQLEDERSFYLKEKEQYCQEMNDLKKLRRQESKHKLNTCHDYTKDNKVFEEENIKLKAALKDTLQANYNLSVKFLRMKNTKFCIKNRLKKLQLEHNKVITEMKTQVEKCQNEIEKLVSRQIQLHVSPSNKKYLQIMKTNSQLLHENLNLQARIDQLNYDLDVLRASQVKQETCSKLKYISSSKSPENCGGKDVTAKKMNKESQTDIRLTDEILISEYMSTKFTNISMTRKSSLSTAMYDNEEDNYSAIAAAAAEADEAENSEVVRTQSAPGLVQNMKYAKEAACFVKTAESFTNT